MTVIKTRKNYDFQGCKFVKTTKFVPISLIKYNFSGNILQKAFIHSVSNNYSLKLTQIAYTTCNNVVIPCFL